MSLAVLYSRALDGLHTPEVVVEVHLANGLPSFTLVGLADTEVKEARERVRAALLNSGLEFPHNKRITVNLAPADLPKEGGRFDLPIALGILAASGQIAADRLGRMEFAGELSLAGDLRPVRGALAMAAAMKRSGTARTLVLPLASAHEAALVEGLNLRGAAHLLDVVHELAPVRPAPADAGAGRPPDDTPSRPASDGAVARSGLQRVARPALAPGHRPPVDDLRDVKGQASAKRALEIAAAGGHAILFMGPPGAGKSMLAQRLAAVLPPMTEEEALESAAVLSVAGRFELTQWGQRVVRTPHHSASAVALVGGGTPPRPGEISLAHHGVLFLDELVEFNRAALEALREPLETGCITISRAARQAEFPARFQLVAAMNPCPCGYLGGRTRACRCSPDQIARYQGRLSGPLLDRIDLQVDVHAVAPAELSTAAPGEPSAAVAARVTAARERQTDRQGCANALLAAGALDTHCALDPAATAFLHAAGARMGWSVRSVHRILRVARTVADLACSVQVQTPHLGEAIQLRRALPAA